MKSFIQRPLKVLFVFPIAQVWGGEEVWLNFLERIDKSKIIPFCLIFGEGLLLERLKQIGVPYYIFAKARIRNIYLSLKNLLRMVSLLKKERFDSVNSLGTHLLTALSTSFLNISYILHIHTIHRLPLIDRWCLGRAKNIITVSNFSKGFLAKYGVNPDYIKVIYNGIDIEKLKKKIKGTDLRRELRLDEDVDLVCYAGRIVKGKNLEMLIKAIPKIKNDYILGRLRFLFVGETPKIKQKQADYKESLLELARELGVEEDVIFMGRREDMADILSQIDIFAIPSLLEVCSMSILEAMAMKRPVVAIREGGNPELVTKDVGILVEPEDLVGFAEAIVELLKDKEKRQRMGEAGYFRVKKFFGLEDNVKELEYIQEKSS